MPAHDLNSSKTPILGVLNFLLEKKYMLTFWTAMISNRKLILSVVQGGIRHIYEQRKCEPDGAPVSRRSHSLMNWSLYSHSRQCTSTIRASFGYYGNDEMLHHIRLVLQVSHLGV